MSSDRAGLQVEILVDGSQRTLRVNATLNGRFERFSPHAESSADDPDMFRLREFRVAGETLYLETEVTNYPQFRATRDLRLPRSLRWSRQANPIAVCCVCRSSDGFILLERRSEGVELYPGAFHVVGGYAEVAADTRHGIEPMPDFEQAICREIGEEIAGATPARHTLRLLGLLYDLRFPHPELAYTCELSHPVAHLQVIARGTPEFHDMHPVADSGAELSRFLSRNATAIVPTGLAALVLYGRHRFGPAWLESIPDCLRDLESAYRQR